MTRHIRKTFDRERYPFYTTGVSATHQAHKDECDVNRIMAKWQKTGVLEHRNTYQGNYGDFTNLPMDYQESLNAVIAAEEMFSSLPGKVRKRFGNDPANFLEFVQDPSNRDEMIELGLAKRTAEGPSDVLEGDTPKTSKKALSEAKNEPKKSDEAE